MRRIKSSIGGRRRTGRRLVARRCRLEKSPVRTRKVSRPRESRERTVPTGKLRTDAISPYPIPSSPVSKITARCSSDSFAMARSRSRNSSLAVWSGERAKSGSAFCNSILSRSRAIRRARLICWLCRIVNSQARRSVPSRHWWILPSARARQSWTRSSAATGSRTRAHARSGSRGTNSTGVLGVGVHSRQTPHCGPLELRCHELLALWGAQAFNHLRTGAGSAAANSSRILFGLDQAARR
jgi:hypothetical protein